MIPTSIRLELDLGLLKVEFGTVGLMTMLGVDLFLVWEDVGPRLRSMRHLVCRDIGPCGGCRHGSLVGMVVGESSPFFIGSEDRLGRAA